MGSLFGRPEGFPLWPGFHFFASIAGGSCLGVVSPDGTLSHPFFAFLFDFSKFTLPEHARYRAASPRPYLLSVLRDLTLRQVNAGVLEAEFRRHNAAHAAACEGIEYRSACGT